MQYFINLKSLVQSRMHLYSLVRPHQIIELLCSTSDTTANDNLIGNEAGQADLNAAQSSSDTTAATSATAIVETNIQRKTSNVHNAKNQGSSKELSNVLKWIEKWTDKKFFEKRQLAEWTALLTRRCAALDLKKASTSTVGKRCRAVRDAPLEASSTISVIPSP